MFAQTDVGCIAGDQLLWVQIDYWSMSYLRDLHAHTHTTKIASPPNVHSICL